MAQRIDHLKDRLIDRVQSLAGQRLSAEALVPQLIDCNPMG